jgi:hypothetical protein
MHMVDGVLLPDTLPALRGNETFADDAEAMGNSSGTTRTNLFASMVLVVVAAYTFRLSSAYTPWERFDTHE